MNSDIHLSTPRVRENSDKEIIQINVHEVFSMLFPVTIVKLGFFFSYSFRSTHAENILLFCIVI